jgi:hypothetical protein
MTQKYVRKPDAVTAVKYDGKNADEVITFSKGKAFSNKKPNETGVLLGPDHLTLNTAQGHVILNVGSYLVQLPDGNYAVMLPTVFENRYEVTKGL